MVYTKITIETTVEAIDMVSYTLAEMGVEGIEVEDKIPLTEEEKQAMFIDILPEQKEQYDGFAKISCYIPMEGQETADAGGNQDVSNSLGENFKEHGIHNISELVVNIQAELDKLSEFMDVGPKTVTVDHRDDGDWLYKWKEYFKPFRLEDNIIIKPTWETLQDKGSDDIVIEIDPGIAFGTGSHQTTRLCIRQLKKYIGSVGQSSSPLSSERGNCTVLDVGCGSGILSIIALKLGAEEALGIDIDDIAVKVSGENREQNHIPKEAFVVRQGDLIGDPHFAASIGKQYDIVVANILADVIIPLSGVVAPFMKEDGVFITSGIINTKEEEVREALLHNGFCIEETTYMGDWVSFTAKKQEKEF